jgi:capsule biosynthesis phosphatase
VLVEEKCIIIDIDGTICPIKQAHESYEDILPFDDMVKIIRQYKESGFHIILHTSRNMRTYGGNIGLINANTAKFTMAWLDKHDIPYDEIHFGKPWPGRGGFYVDDKAVRPNEFLSMTYAQIQALLLHE